ncbi:PQQ-binding-like beta-propeller repeat protein [Streptomyces sp. NPDC048659]|uniref:caspase, EACC1-associated type n=1 Tax=Streptomyces sp. NPDC048659 TaxID=3155489 RepID=UPI003412695D
MRASLPDPRASRAVLIGTHTYRRLPGLPAVAGNLTGLAAALRHPSVWGLPESHCTVLAQPENAGQALDALHAQAPEALDTLLVYYAGHGLVDPYTDELYLALPGSEQGRPDGALRYEYVRRAVLDPAVTARRKIVILDCCYSGRALIGEMGAGDHVAAQTLIDGTCLLTSTAETRKALSFPGERYTAFTGELIGVLAAGVPDGPELLDMHTVYREVHARLAAKGRPLPQQRNRNAGGLIVVARNQAHPSARATTAAADRALAGLAPKPVPLLRRISRRTLLVGAAVGTAGLGGAGLGVRRLLLGGEGEAGGTGPAAAPPPSTTGTPSAPSASASTSATPTAPPTTTAASPPKPKAPPTPGSVLWRAKIPVAGEASDVLLVGEVLVLNLDGVLRGYARTSGERVWTLAHSALFTQQLRGTAVDSDVLCVEDEDGYLRGVDVRRGVKKWAYRLGTDTLALRAFAPLVRDGIVYASHPGAPLVALDVATGRKRWGYAPPDGTNSGPAVSDGLVCVGTYSDTSNDVSVVDRRTGRERWRDVSNPSDFLAVDSQCFYSHYLSKITAVDLATRENRWSQPSVSMEAATDLQPFTLAGGVLYTTTVDGQLTARDPWTGSVRWRFPVRYGERFASWGQYALYGGSSPVLDGGTLYLGSLAYQSLPDKAEYREKNRGTRFVHAVDAATGTERWHFEAGGATGSVAVGADAVYVAATDGYLYALAR